MQSDVYYLVRSKQDGQYLVARPRLANAAESDDTPLTEFLLVFKEHADALSYLNAFAPTLTDRFAVESVLGNQLSNVMNRWGYQGFGVVQDPLLPKVEFMLRDRPF